VLQEIAISLASLHNPYFFTFSPRGGEFFAKTDAIAADTSIRGEFRYGHKKDV
jgi:hypothetical protein